MYLCPTNDFISVWMIFPVSEIINAQSGNHPFHPNNHFKWKNYLILLKIVANTLAFSQKNSTIAFLQFHCKTKPLKIYIPTGNLKLFQIHQRWEYKSSNLHAYEMALIAISSKQLCIFILEKDQIHCLPPTRTLGSFESNFRDAVSSNDAAYFLLANYNIFETIKVLYTILFNVELVDNLFPIHKNACLSAYTMFQFKLSALYQLKLHFPIGGSAQIILHMSRKL